MRNTDHMMNQVFEMTGKVALWTIHYNEYTKEQKKAVDYLLDNNIWVTARGTEIPVKEMSSNHIQNCIKCWEGTGNMSIPEGYLGGKEKWLKIFNDELVSRQ